MRKITKLLAVFLAVSISFSAMLMPIPAIGDAAESNVESFELEPISIVENTNGGYWSYYDSSTGEYNRYYYYHSFSNSIKGKITFNDGTQTININGIGFFYNGEYNNLSFSYNQSFENQWTVGGTYEIEVSALGKTVTVPVTIVPSPVESLEIKPISIVENTGGYYADGYDSSTGEYKQYYRYNFWRFINGTITFNDGTEPVNLKNTDYFYYKGEYNSFSISDSQSYQNQWKVGEEYEVELSLSKLGKTVTVPVTIIPSPVESIEIEPISIMEYTGGYYYWGYNSSTGKYERCYRYIVPSSLINGTITFNDGTKPVAISQNCFNYNDESYSFSTSYNQSNENQWTVGGNNELTLTLSKLGKTITVPVIIQPTNIDSVEVLKNSLDSPYDFRFTYRVNYKDGTSAVKYYDGSQNDGYHNYSEIDIVSDSAQPGYQSWNNGDTVYASIGSVNTSFVIDGGSASDYSYVEQDGALYITDCSLKDEDLAIPSEIDGMPVKGIMNLGEAIYSAKNVTIPDSVVFLSDYVFDDYNCSVENVYIGAGVSNITVDMFAYNSDINIQISGNNPNYTCVDGVVYDKEVKTVVYYPLSKGNEYSVPDSVTNVDIFYEYDNLYHYVNLNFGANSKAVIVEDGITYSADKTKVLACDSEKTGDYVMPDTVTEIIKGAFAYSKLSSVQMSDNVTEIVYRTFAFSSIENVKLPKNLKTIAAQAFSGAKLKTLTLPDGLEEIGENAFEDNPIESLEIPSTVKRISEYAFAYTGLSKVTIPDIQISIGYGAFGWCSELKTAGPIGGGYNFEFGFKTDIPSCVFSGTRITSVKLPDSIVTIGARAFSDSSLESVIIPGNVKTIGNYAFSGTCLESVVIPDSVETIGNGSFSTYTLKNVTLGKNLTTIGNYAFSGTKISEIVFNEKLSSIGEGAFRNTHLEKLNLPETVTEIAYETFAYAFLKEVTLPHGLKRISNAAFEDTSWYNSLPDGYYNEYLLYATSPDNSGNNVTDYTVKDGTTVIADMAFQDMTNLETVQLPEGLITIGDQAFFNCSSLTSINIPASVEYIGFDSFEGCTSLSDVTVDPNNKYYTVYNNALYNKDKTVLIRCFDKSSKVFEVPNTVTLIVSNAFEGCDVNKIKITNNDIELYNNSLTTYPYFDNLYKETNGSNSSVRTIICGENSNAYNNAIDNLLEVEIIPEGGTIDIMYGDVNNDSNVDGLDVVRLKKYLANYDYDNDTSTVEVFAGADANGDGEINGLDVVRLKKYLANYDYDTGVSTIVLGPQN